MSLLSERRTNRDVLDLCALSQGIFSGGYLLLTQKKGAP